MVKWCAYLTLEQQRLLFGGIFFLNCKALIEIPALKAEYVRCRKQFDQAVQRANRLH